MKRKVGSNAKIRNDMNVGTTYGNCEFTVEMQEFEGDKVAITEVIEEQSQYKIKEDGGVYFWHDRMFK